MPNATLTATAYDDLDRKLGARDRIKLGNNTWALRRDDGIGVRYHWTIVVTFRPDGAMVLHSGGYRTMTTKDRIDQFLYANRGLRLCQERGEWWIIDPHDSGYERIPFEDGMVV